MELNSVRVPGKVMLSGEYAVLHGGTAVLIPVPRYLTLSETEAPPAHPHSPVINAALAEPIAEIADFEARHPLSGMEVDRREFVTQAGGAISKLGLGSSAAEAVGVIALRLERMGIPYVENRSLVAELAMRAHNRAQGGAGSGADVAVIAYGEPILFRRYGEEVTITTVEQEKREILPPLALLWSGIAANTRRLVAQFEQWCGTADRAEGYLAELIRVGDRVAETWFSGDSTSLFGLLEEYDQQMSRCMGAAKIEWKTPLHREIGDWAKRHGGHSKPTGAGAGDMILTVGTLPYGERSELRIDLSQPLLHM